MHVERRVAPVRAGAGEAGCGRRVHHALRDAVTMVTAEHVVHLTVGRRSTSSPLVLNVTRNKRSVSKVRNVPVGLKYTVCVVK